MGDEVRKGVSADLGFSIKDRTENIRRAGEAAKLLADQGNIVLASFISSIRQDRLAVRVLFKKDEFIEVYCNSSLESCRGRDVKGLYKKATLGRLSNFTGVDSIYEIPFAPEVTLKTDFFTIDVCVDTVITDLIKRGLA